MWVPRLSNRSVVEEMPKGYKRVEDGSEIFWFQCACGHRWTGRAQRAKDLAWRLHQKKCDLAAEHMLTDTQQKCRALACFSARSFGVDASLNEITCAWPHDSKLLFSGLRPVPADANFLLGSWSAFFFPLYFFFLTC